LNTAAVYELAAAQLAVGKFPTVGNFSPLAAYELASASTPDEVVEVVERDTKLGLRLAPIASSPESKADITVAMLPQDRAKRRQRSATPMMFLWAVHADR
jgi:hypothetical protein